MVKSIRQRIGEIVMGRVNVGMLSREMKENIIAEMKDSGILKEAISVEREEDRDFRPITGAKRRDLTALTQDRMFEICFYLYDSNPFAHRILEMTKDFVIGEGITFQAADDNVQKVLKAFWDDPINGWDLKQGQKILELGLYGEQYYPVAVNEADGRVRLGYLDPQSVKEVKTDPDNVEIQTQVIRKGIEGEEDEGGKERKTEYSVIRMDENAKSKTEGKLVGEIFAFQINKVANSTRGRSDLFSLADWIDGYDQFLFNRLERSHLMNVFLWDVELRGMKQKDIDKWLEGQGVPKPGSIRAHNEYVKWSTIVPDLGAHDASEEAKLFRNQILGGGGLPPHWYAGGEGITRATALEMSTPVMKRLKARQRYFKYMITLIFMYVIDQAVIHGKVGVKEETDKRFVVSMPKLLEKDFYTLSLGMKFVMEAIATAQEKKWVEDKTAKRIFRELMERLGLEIGVVLEGDKGAGTVEKKGDTDED